MYHVLFSSFPFTLSSYVCLGYSDFTAGFEDDSCWKRGVFAAVGGAPALSGANDGAVLERAAVTERKDLTAHI